MLLSVLTHAKKECTDQLALPWGDRHLISPALRLAGKDIMILLHRVGFEDLHSFAFIGSSGRISTASDGLFSYVPAGPNKQIDMFLRAYDLRKKGRLQVCCVPLDLTRTALHQPRMYVVHHGVQIC